MQISVDGLKKMKDRGCELSCGEGPCIQDEFEQVTVRAGPGLAGGYGLDHLGPCESQEGV